MTSQASARYRFRKNFRVSADAAYAWLTDFDADDLKLMGGSGRRDVLRWGPDVYLLVDHLRRNGRPITKRKLVHLYPEDHRWISTYIGGPSIRSQFLYEIEPRGPGRSRLTFTGVQMDARTRTVRGPGLARYARELRIEDSATWTRIVRTLHRELARSERGA